MIHLTSNINVSPILIMLMLVAIIIYLWGVYFHVKIIQVSKKDKDLTWRLDIANSITMIIIFLQAIIMHTITYIIRDLYLYTGQWFCYAFKVIGAYSAFYIMGHSLIVSLMKYTVIVHWQKAREWGNERVAMVYFWINITFPVIYILIWLCIRPDFFLAYDNFAHIDRCLGDPKDMWVDSFERLEKNKSLTRLYDLCQMAAPLQEDYIDHTIHMVRTCSCWLYLGCNYATFSNLLELGVYFQLFSFLRR